MSRKQREQQQQQAQEQRDQAARAHHRAMESHYLRFPEREAPAPRERVAPTRAPRQRRGRTR